MAFLSSIFSKLTDPNGQTSRSEVPPDYSSLTCRDEVDDFLMVTESQDSTRHNQTAAALQMQPPTYYEVTRADNQPPPSSNPPTVSMATNEAEAKHSPLDGVPFTLWYGHTSADHSSLLAGQTASLFSQSCTPEGINSRYKYTFDTERTVLREYDGFLGDDPHVTGNPPSQASYLDSRYNSGYYPTPAETERSNPPVGCLVDLT